jgi:hypothetical protein
MRWFLTSAGVLTLVLLAITTYWQNVSDAVQYKITVVETETEIWEVVDRAVSTHDYTKAGSMDELEQILARTYAGPLLSSLTGELWQEWPSDNVVQAEVVDRCSIEIYGNDARAVVGVYFPDWTDGSEWYGTGAFELARLKSGWRIVDHSFEWHQKLRLD